MVLKLAVNVTADVKHRVRVFANKAAVQLAWKNLAALFP
jgi:hypothetical protein